ncbi:MAG: hypothetical protein PWP76_754 [Candidatus Diapherotrites archaeon]|nr:hypothetical protein [Candidatus Diapherotrites archaeon]MDN5367244.1 hypothetical protein [Candidatus Diapherotrites archaeon]
MENATLFPDELSLLLKVSEIYLIPEHREMKKLSQRVRAANAHLIAIPAALAAMEAGVRLDKSFFHGIYHQYKRFDPDLAHEVYKAIIELRPRPEDVYRALNRVDPARVHYRRFLEELIKHMTTGRA